MKRIIILLAALTLAASAPAQAQGLLNKLKEKAEQAVGNISQSVGDVVGGTLGDIVGGKTRNDDKNSVGVVSGEQALPPRRSSTFGWDGPVTPSSAGTPAALMAAFPKVPSAAALAHPTEADQIAFYQAVKAVTLRAEELNSDTTCEDDETRMWRDKSNKILRDSFGLTDREIAMLERDDLSEAEQQQLSDKIAKAMLGDLDIDALEKQAAQYEGKSEEEIVATTMNNSMNAIFAVYDRNASDIRKYMGVSAEDLKNATRAQMNSSTPDKESAEMKAINAKAKAFQKEQAAKNPGFQKEADAFEKRMQQETMQATMSASGLGNLGGMLGSISDMQKKVSPIIEMEQKLVKYYTEVQDLLVIPDTGADAQFSAADRKKVLDLKDKIYATDDASVYNPLYLQALELIKSYRERAAKAWAADVQKRFDAVKNNMDALIKLNRQAVQDELLPECALYRLPLNAVITAGDILEEAYSEFPSNYPPMYKEEIVLEVSLSGVPGGGNAWFPEFSVFGASHFDDIASGKYIFASNAAGDVYQFSGGSWTKLSDQKVKELSAMKKTATPAGQTFKSQDGRREVVFNAEGGYIMLPEGDEIFQPHAWKAFSNKIQWLNVATTEDGKYQLILCTYKL